MTFCVAIADKITGLSRQILFEGLPPQTQDLHGFFICQRLVQPRSFTIMDSNNPYSPPIGVSSSHGESGAVIRFRAASIVVSAILGSIYVFVFGASIYEYAHTTPPSSTTDYVRTAIASAAFATLSFAATIFYLKRLRIGHWFLCVSPLLLAVFVFPGLNAVWNSVGRLLRF